MSSCVIKGIEYAPAQMKVSKMVKELEIEDLATPRVIIVSGIGREGIKCEYLKCTDLGCYVLERQGRAFQQRCVKY